MNPSSGIKRRGFASMSPEQRKAIASRGGRTAHQRGTAHEWSKEEAVEVAKKGAGFTKMPPAKHKEVAAKGGRQAQRLGTGHKWNSTEAREAGRKSHLPQRKSQETSH